MDAPAEWGSTERAVQSPPKLTTLTVSLNLREVKKLKIREEVLCDARYPVHRIAERIRPYLQVLVDQFQPEQVILFGSYASGTPDDHSDVDLLIIKTIEKSSLADRREILKAWRPLRWAQRPVPFELLVVSPHDHRRRSAEEGGFYSSITRNGLVLA